MLAGMYENKALIVIHRVEHALATKLIKHNIHAYVQL